MKESKTTRFEVGMPVIYINDGQIIEACIQSISSKWYIKDVHFPIVIRWDNESLDYTTENFDINGFNDVDDTFPSLFTIPEYEALKRLTDSFVDGTFQATAKRQDMVLNPNPKLSAVVKFEPQKDEPIIYNGKEYVIKDSVTWHTLQFINGVSSVKECHVKPIEGYPYANGFCIALLKEQTDTEQPETTDLLDGNGQPVYFEVEQEVGCIANSETGKVCRIEPNTGNVIVDFPRIGIRSFTYDGKDDTGTLMLYPIEQYNVITLPKLKPIQVPKPKADVISLPSWFKGGAMIPSYDVMKYLSDNFNEQVSNKIESLIRITGAESLVNCGTYECSNTGVIFMRFSFDNKLYDIWVYTGQKGLDSMVCNYNKNGKDISEKLC